MTAKHTPGPWWLTEGKVKRDGSRVCHISGGGWHKFARIWVRASRPIDCVQVDDVSGIANARLIAAAPDMYDVLVDVADGYQMTTDKNPLARKLRAALAKAEGRT